VPEPGLTIAVELAPARSDIDLVGRRAAVEQATGCIQDARRGSIQSVNELGELVEEPLIAFLLKETQVSWFHTRQRIEAACLIQRSTSSSRLGVVASPAPRRVALEQGFLEMSVIAMANAWRATVPG
jgi:hypothetical protein